MDKYKKYGDLIIGSLYMLKYGMEKATLFDYEENVELKPLNIYLSGSDSRSTNLSANTRSDVNMIVSINPSTHEILLTSIPRDYYVQVQTGNFLNEFSRKDHIRQIKVLHQLNPYLHPINFVLYLRLSNTL